MENWMILLIVLAGVVVIAPIIGVIVGKQIAKQKNNPKKPVFGVKGKFLFSISLILGVACITTAFLLPKPQPEIPNIEGMEEEMMTQNGGSGGGVSYRSGSGVAGGTVVIG